MAMIENLRPRNITHSTGADGSFGWLLDVIEEVEEDGVSIQVLPGPIDGSITPADVVIVHAGPALPGAIYSAGMSAPVVAGEKNETMPDAGGGLVSGLAPGVYTIYACADGVDLITHTLEIEDISGPDIGAVTVVDVQRIVSNSSTSAAVALLSESDLAGAEEGGDSAIIVITQHDEDYAVPGPVTYGGEALAQIHNGVGGSPRVWARLGVSAIGSLPLSVAGDPFDASALVAVAYSLRGVQSIRAINAAAVAGDLGLILGARAFGTLQPPPAPWGSASNGLASGSGGAVAVGHQQLDADGVPSLTWSSSSHTAYLALEPLPADVVPEDPPEAIPTFDAAAGSDRMLLRNVSYSGGDTDTRGFGLQYQVGAGTPIGYAGPYSVDGEAVASGAHVVISDLTPGAVYELRMRAVNDSGDGDWSDWFRLRVHLPGHSHGIKRHHPAPRVGHTVGSYDVDDPASGGAPLTAGGRSDRAVLVGADIGYVAGSPVSAAVMHDWTYDDEPMALAGAWYEEAQSGAVVRNDSGGGATVHVLAGVAAGTHDLAWANASGIGRSQWFAACALSNVDQSSPIGGIDAGLWAHDLQTGGPPLLPLAGNAGMAYRYAGGIPCALDEAVVVLTGFYARGIGPFSSATQETVPAALGEGAGNAPARVIASGDMDGMLTAPAGSELVAGSGAGLEDGSKLWWYPESLEPGTQIDGDYFRFWATIAPVAIRPSPNMLHSADVEGGEWQCESDCNHGRILIAVTPQSDPSPTAQQIRDAIDETSEDSPYGGTFVLLDETGITAEGPQSGALGELGEGEYRLSLVYESWQWRLGDPIAVSFEEAGVIRLDASDALPLGISEAVAVSVALSAEHSLPITTAELLTATPRATVSDSATLAVAQNLALSASLEAADVAALGLVDEARITGAAFVGDLLTMALIDVAEAFPMIGASDALALAIQEVADSEQASVTTQTVSDALAVTLSETATAGVSHGVSDAPRLSISELLETAGHAEVSDALALGLEMAAGRGASMEVADSLELGVGEAAETAPFTILVGYLEGLVEVVPALQGRAKIN